MKVSQCQPGKAWFPRKTFHSSGRFFDYGNSFAKFVREIKPVVCAGQACEWQITFRLPETADFFNRCLWEGLKSDMERLVRSLEGGARRWRLLLWCPQWYLVYDAATPGGLI